MPIDIEVFDDRIESLKTELESYGKEIINLITCIYGSYETGPTFDLKNNAFQMINLLKQETIEMIHQCEEHEYQKKQYEYDLQQCLTMSTALLTIATICTSLTQFEQALTKLYVVECCELLIQIEQEITKLPSANSSLIGSGKVCMNLRHEYQLCSSRLKSKIRRLLFEAIQFEYGNMIICKSMNGYIKAEDKVIDEPLPLTELWEAIVLTNCTESIVETLFIDIWKYILTPLWKEKKSDVTRYEYYDESFRIYFRKYRSWTNN